MSIETALVAGGIELIKFILSRILDAEKNEELKTGKEKHESVKDAVKCRFTNEYIHCATDDIIKCHVDVLNESGAFKRGCDNVTRGE